MKIVNKLKNLSIDYMFIILIALMTTGLFFSIKDTIQKFNLEQENTTLKKKLENCECK